VNTIVDPTPVTSWAVNYSTAINSYVSALLGGLALSMGGLFLSYFSRSLWGR
jgi:hypothetical protein